MGSSIRNKLMAAFAALVLVAGAGGAVGLVRLHELAGVLTNEQREVGVHERVGVFRASVMGLSAAAYRLATMPPTRASDEIPARLRGLKNQSVWCDSCHAQHGMQQPVHSLLVPIEAQLRQLYVDQASGSSLASKQTLHRLEASTAALQNAIGKMEQRYIVHVESSGVQTSSILEAGERDLLILVLGGIAIAMLLAFVVARSMSRPVQQLIIAARQMGEGDVTVRAPVPSEPSLAELASSLNEMSLKVAARARDSMRRQLLDRLMASQEDERKRIARELHDELGQSLSSLLMAVRREADAGGVAEAVKCTFEEKIGDLIEQVRGMAWYLRPSILDDYGLDSALGRHTEEVAQVKGIPVDYQCVRPSGHVDRLPPKVELVMYRIGQEAITNAVRHAEATRVSVVLLLRHDEVTLLVEDDGKGFDVGAVRGGDTADYLGLMGMEERVGMVGGTITVISSPGKGTTVRAKVPLGDVD